MKRTTLLILIISLTVFGKTPKLNISLTHGSAGEQKRRDQIERLAGAYDLSKYTITTDIIVDEQAMNHSSPVLTLNLRFLDNDDRALSAYVHEQGHWVILTRHRSQVPEMLAELQRMYPNIDITPPHGDGNLRTSYMHLP